jgi:hypothetical protein
MTTLLNRTDGRPDELTLIRSEPISMQWTNELRRNVGLHPSCIIERGLELGPIHSDSCLPIPNQGLEFESDRRSLEGFRYHHSKAIGNRSRATEEEAGSASLESKTGRETQE